MDYNQFWTFAIATFGLAIALVSLVWNYYLHGVSKPKVQVTATIIEPTPLGLPKGHNVLLIEAVNLRSRPVTIKGFHGKFLKSENREDRFWFIGSHEAFAGSVSRFPCQIKESDTATLMVLLDTLEDPRNIDYFFAADTTGKDCHSIHRPLIRQLDKMRCQSKGKALGK